ncbi:hypothetical protein J4G33_02330 [Actinotalea sp. BY-33]|uniref:Transglutaminase-like domain-containing protein n=1 Tax=Actinotalea soli TaxID=2819234 RepID=A0A939LMT2_9CELL|nr:hypothetical protein [Actinotalea soli]
MEHLCGPSGSFRTIPNGFLPPRASRGRGAPQGCLSTAGGCASYAAAFKVLADAAGLDAVYVNGVASATNEGHAWNKVRIGSTWRFVDSRIADDAAS